MTGVELHPLDGAGVEVRCVDLTDLTSADVEQLQTAFRDHGLLCFREQFVGDAALAAFARRWGTPRPDPAWPSHPTVDAMGVETRGPDVAADLSAQWRCDRSFEAAPPMATLAVARDLPLGGGGTRFVSLPDAHDALDSATRRHLEGLRAVHRSPDGRTQHTHPLVIRHPISGRAVVYANPAHTQEVEGLDPTASLALLNQLFAHCTHPDFVHDFDWEPGSVVLWDNRSIMHLAPNDHPGQIRRLHRILLAGEPLTPAAVAPSTDPTLAQRAGTTVAGAVVTAAMLGLGHVIEPEKATADIEITADAPEAEPLDSLDFGSLPPLD